jgi:hypothetical protein
MVPAVRSEPAPPPSSIGRPPAGSRAWS